MTCCVKHRQKCDIAYTGFVLLSHHPITGILVARTLNYKANLDDHFQLSAFPFQFSVSAFRFLRFHLPLCYCIIWLAKQVYFACLCRKPPTHGSWYNAEVYELAKAELAQGRTGERRRQHIERITQIVERRSVPTGEHSTQLYYRSVP